MCKSDRCVAVTAIFITARLTIINQDCAPYRMSGEVVTDAGISPGLPKLKGRSLPYAWRARGLRSSREDYVLYERLVTGLHCLPSSWLHPPPASRAHLFPFSVPISVTTHHSISLSQTYLTVLPGIATLLVRKTSGPITNPGALPCGSGSRLHFQQGRRQRHLLATTIYW